jgi:hypothetical protein
VVPDGPLVRRNAQRKFRRLPDSAILGISRLNHCAALRGTKGSNPPLSSGEMLWGGRRGWQFRRLHQSMECRDAPAERFEQVPGCPGPR